MANREPKVHAKYFNKDAWEPIEETLCLRSLSYRHEVPKFARMSPLDS